MVFFQCDWNSGGDPVNMCDEIVERDGDLCEHHKHALSQLEAMSGEGL